MALISIGDTIDDYLGTIALARSENTTRTYRNALNAFQAMLNELGIDPIETQASATIEDWVADFAGALKSYAPASERLYLTATAGWYEYLAAEELADINLSRMRMLIRRRGRRPGQRLPQFPRRQIEDTVEYAKSLIHSVVDDERVRLRNLRDRGFLLTLADTGLRVHEACSLRRADIDWNEGRAILIGKGDRESIVRFSSRSLSALKDYLRLRAELDGGSGRPLASLPLFARHDRGAGKKVLPITTTTGRAIVHKRVTEALGSEATGTITPHSFRHYFVTTVLRGSGGNLKLAQELARHRSIAVTQRYAHLSDDELDRGYHEIFEK
ncbi:MAG: tyrosine-type recombinase/integrase [Anaerolineales bacterium]|nr:tyrosine-type recombinase/integrase [Anaerolineales bacterium]MCK5633555.1 tyrosine-type recombinase/integrase [Anaerolineales bacterium]